MENEVKEEVKNEEVQSVETPSVTPEPEQKSKGMIVVVVLLVIVILGLGGYILYDKVIANKEETPTNNSENKQEEKKEESKKEEENKEESNGEPKAPETVVVNKEKNISYTASEIQGAYELKKVVIGGKDVTSSIEYGFFGGIDFNEQKDFVAILFTGFWTAGHGQDGLFVFDYNGNLLYKNKRVDEDTPSDNFPSIKSEMYFKGEYEYKEAEKTLYITYSIPCDTETRCNEFLERDDTLLCKYKDEIVSKVYKVTFNNGKFSNEELYKSIKMSDDKYFKDDVLAACK